MLSKRDQEKVQAALSEMGELLKEDKPLNKEFQNDDLRIIYALAHSLYQRGDYEQAGPIFQQLASLKPFEQKYWAGLAACFQMEKKYGDALKGWAMAALLIQSDPLPHYHAAECYKVLGNQEDAVKALKSAYQRLEPKDEALKHKLQEIEISLKQREENYG